MPRKNPHVEEADENNLEVAKPKDWAAGIPGVYHSMQPALKHMGVGRAGKTLLGLNQKDGFDCMSCAWPDPGHRKTFEFCEQGAKAVTWEATPVVIPSGFWAENPVSELRGRSEYWLGMQGRLTEPVYKPAGEDHYRPVSWDEAFSIVGSKLQGLDSPDQAAFYTSGRTSNEAAFLYQLFVRAYGTNNLPDCSNMCHESSGWAMGQTIGVGKATISYDDFAKADLIIIMGQNPGSNHPRMLTALEEAKEAGCEIVAINPLPEAGLMRYKNPQKVKGILGRGTELADQYLQIRLGGDMALMQALSKRVLDAESKRPGTVLDHDFLREHCQGLEELKAHLAGLREETVLRATGLSSMEIDELAERYLRAGKGDHHLGHGHHAAQEGRAHHQGDHQPSAAARKHRQARRRRLADPRPQQRPGRPHHGHLGADAAGLPGLARQGIQLRTAARTRRGRRGNHPQMRDGGIRVFVAMGGNFVAAISDTHAA